MIKQKANIMKQNDSKVKKLRKAYIEVYKSIVK